MKPTPVQRGKFAHHIAEALALLDRHIPEDEQREAARSLGLEHWLPDPQESFDLSA
jgi:hypothetical protein